MNADRRQALAFRFAGHHLDHRVDARTAAASTGLQDTPPGSAVISLAARSDEGPDGLVTVYGMRGAPFLVPVADLAVFTAALRPPDEKAAAALLRTAAKAHPDVAPTELLERATAAVADALDGRELERDAFHQALRERLEPELLWWCRNCGSHHVHPELWRATGLNGVLAVTGRRGRSAVFGRPPEAPPAEDAGAELVRRFLRAYGPATRQMLGSWAGIGTDHARGLWQRVEAELAEVSLEGKRAWILAADAERLEHPPSSAGVRLVPGLDPYLAQRDRERFVPDESVRHRMWRMLGNPGAVLAGAELVGLWRAAKKGAKLTLTVERLAPFTPEDLEDESRRMAGVRGCADVEVSVTAGT